LDEELEGIHKEMRGAHIHGAKVSFEWFLFLRQRKLVELKRGSLVIYEVEVGLLHVGEENDDEGGEAQVEEGDVGQDLRRLNKVQNHSKKLLARVRLV